jgi:hypothetical protein
MPQAIRICRNCGTTFLAGSGAAKLCQSCKDAIKLEKTRKLIIPGNYVGKIEVIDRIKQGNEAHSYYRYKCRCSICDREFMATAQIVNRYANTGCSSCRKILRDQERLNNAKIHIGERHGQIVIQNVHLKVYRSVNRVFAECICDCNAKTDILLSRILDGASQSCGHDTNKNLQKGRDLINIASKTGTSILSIDGRHTLNKNSSTGVNGVSYNAQTGRYRAYIHFRRKQYNLGMYDNLNDAAAARKNAEKEIYGNFLTWYEKEYPEQWARLRNKP